MGKKVGIITHYYNSENYGGLLQAYALCEALNKQGNSAEQISFDTFSSKNKTKSIYKKLRSFLAKTCHALLNLKINKKFAKRKKAFKDFRESIPHSKPYTCKTIKNCVDDYQAFITGSDQVWNLTWYYPEYFLDFVPNEKKKISYAASIGLDLLGQEQKQIFKNSLKSYNAVSVREESAVELIKDLSPVPVSLVLDPTLLLDKEDWDKVCAERVIKEKYLFCYFLGENPNSRKLATKYALENGLKIVTLPHLLGNYRKCDAKFGDKKLYSVSPNQFLSLIKHAEVVFTDSFHATVFSNVFQKEYFIFRRNSLGKMGGRIYSLTKLFESEERFCDNDKKESLEYINSLNKIDYNKSLEAFINIKEKSLEFLKAID